MRFPLCTAAGLLGLITLLPSTSSAYCRTTTYPGEASGCPEECETRGIPLYWPSKALDYTLNQRPFPDLDDERLRGLLRESFGAWEQVSCADGPAGLDIQQQPGTTDLTAGPQELEPNDNVIAYLPRDEWRDDRSAFAITKIWFNARNGHILGADMLFNGNLNPFFDCPAPAGCPAETATDFRNVATHEAGHFLGLAHSEIKDSTMWCDATKGEVRKRDLHADDRAGLCAIYGDSVWQGPATSGRRGSSSGCSVGFPAQGGQSSGLGLLLLLPAALWARGRRRRG